jgi:hypothetical protein
MEIVLKNIYVGERLRRETTAFQASLYVNGVKVAVVSNDGQGGCVQYHPTGDKGILLIREAEVWCQKLPPVVFEDTLINDRPVTIPMDLEIYIDDLVTAWLKQKDLERFRFKMKKAMRSAILFGVPDKSYREMRYRMPIEDMIRYGLGVERLRLDIHKQVIPMLGAGEKILNTNIPAAVMAKLGVDKALLVG